MCLNSGNDNGQIFNLKILFYRGRMTESITVILCLAIIETIGIKKAIKNPIIHKIKLIEKGLNQTLHNPNIIRIKSPSLFKR